MAYFWPYEIFCFPDCGNQEGLGASGWWVWCTQYAHAITKNSSHLGQVLGSCRASKSKKSNFSLFSKNEKYRFLQVTKVDRSQQRRELRRSRWNHQYLTKMHCSHFNISWRLGLFWENGGRSQTMFWGYPKILKFILRLKKRITAKWRGLSKGLGHTNI